MNSKLLSYLFLGIVTFSLCRPALAQDQGDPVAVVSLVWGAVTIKHPGADYKPARWLEPVFPGDQLMTSGPGSKLLITFFSDNHQEVMGQDMVATAAADGLAKSSGAGDIRKDPARNPFGAGGVESPFIYTHRLREADFQGAEVAGALESERPTLRARVRAGFPPTFAWTDTGAAGYTLSIYDPATGSAVWTKEVSGTRYQLSQDEGNQLLKGVNYRWDVNAGDQVVVRPYEFKLLTLPLAKWFDQQVVDFDGKRDRDQLQRSDWTDYLTVCAQVLDIDRAFELAEKMKEMDPQNPRIYRVLTRIYLRKGCPAHAKAAYDKEIALGALDPIYP
jgi:hypothetical protein